MDNKELLMEDAVRFEAWEVRSFFSVLEKFKAVGDVKFLVRFLDGYSGPFLRSEDAELRARARDQVRSVERMVEFERTHGEGSCLNLDNEYVRATLRGDANPYEAERILNAGRFGKGPSTF